MCIMRRMAGISSTITAVSCRDGEQARSGGTCKSSKAACFACYIGTSFDESLSPWRYGVVLLRRDSHEGVLEVAGSYAPLSSLLVTEWCPAQTAVLLIWNCVKAMYSVDIDNLSRFSLGEWSGGIGPGCGDQTSSSVEDPRLTDIRAPLHARALDMQRAPVSVCS